MRTRLLLLTGICFVVLLLLAGCSGSESEAPSPTAVPVVEVAPTEAPAATAAPTATAEPEPKAALTATDEPEPTVAPSPTMDPAAAVVLEMIARANAGDYAGAAELVSDDMMSYFIGLPPTGVEIYWGREQFQTFLEECCTDQHFEWEVIPKRVEDGVVIAEARTWMDFTRELGVAPNTWNEIYVVRDGKITLYTSTITEEALAKFRPALDSAMPGAFSVPPKGEEAVVSEISVTIANGTCAYDGSMNLQAGPLTVNAEVQDEDWEKYALTFFTLEPGYDMFDLMTSTWRPNPPPWSNLIYTREFSPGDGERFELADVEPGMLYLICWGGTPDSAIGNAGPFYVVP